MHLENRRSTYMGMLIIAREVHALLLETIILNRGNHLFQTLIPAILEGVQR